MNKRCLETDLFFSCQEDRFSKDFILWASLAVSAWSFLVYYPGIFYADSFERWDLYFQLVRMEGASRYMGTVLPSLWMGFTYWATGSKAAVSFLQAFLFFYSSLFLIRNIGNFKGGWCLLSSAIFIFCPLFQGYSVFNEPGIGTVIGLNFFFILIFSRNRSGGFFDNVFRFFIYFLIFSTIFGFRSNTITILPVVLFIFLRKFQSRRNFGVPCISLVMSLIFVFTLPCVLTQWRHVQKLELVSIGVAWETVQIIGRTHDPQYDGYLDYAGRGKGATKNALVNVGETEWDGFLGGQGLQLSRVITPSIARQIMRDYGRIICAHPWDFMMNKIYIFGRVLGISKPLVFNEFMGDWQMKLAQEGFRSTPKRDHAIKDLNRFMNDQCFLRKPFLIFLAGFLCLQLSWLFFRKEAYFIGIMFLGALFYYAAFFITTQSFEFRYFFPPFFLITVMAIVVGTKIIDRLVNYFKGIRGSSSE